MSTPSQLMDAARCVSCAVPVGMRMGVLNAVVNNQTEQMGNLIPIGSQYGVGGGFTLSGLLPGSTYSFTFSTNDAVMLMGSPPFNTPIAGALGQVVIFTMNATGKLILVSVGHQAGIPVTAILKLKSSP